MYDYHSEGDDDSPDKHREDSSFMERDSTIPIIDHDDNSIKIQRLAKMKEHQKYFTEKIQETTQTSNSKVHDKRKISSHYSYHSEDDSEESNHLIQDFILLGIHHIILFVS